MKPAPKPAALEDPHELSILAALGEARSHFKVLPVSRNALYVRRYRHRLRLAKLATAGADPSATNNGAGSGERSGAADPTARQDDGRRSGPTNPPANPA